MSYFEWARATVKTDVKMPPMRASCPEFDVKMHVYTQIDAILDSLLFAHTRFILKIVQ